MHFAATRPAATLAAIPVLGRCSHERRKRAGGWRAGAPGSPSALRSLAWLLIAGAARTPGPTLFALGNAGALQLSLRSDALGCTMLLIVGYSQPTVNAANRATSAA